MVGISLPASNLKRASATETACDSTKSSIHASKGREVAEGVVFTEDLLELDPAGIGLELDCSEAGGADGTSFACEVSFTCEFTGSLFALGTDEVLGPSKGGISCILSIFLLVPGIWA